MRFRKLRIAWSVFWGLAAMLLIVLSVRSFTWADQSAVRVSATHHLMVTSQLGGIEFYLDDSPRVIRISQTVDVLYAERPKPQLLGMFYVSQGRYGFGVPHWFFALTTGAIATIPWKPWRFSLRTLLIAITAVAVVLGLIVWLR